MEAPTSTPPAPPSTDKRESEDDRNSIRSSDRKERSPASEARRSAHHGRDDERDKEREKDYDHDETDERRERRRRRESRSPPPSRRDRDRDRERDRDRGYYRDRDRDRDRDRERRDRERERERRRHREEDYYYEERRRRERSPRESRRSRRRRERTPSPKLTEEEHERRSVFVSQLSARVGDRELTQFFNVHAGSVREARVIVDRVTRRSKGVGYVEFKEEENVQKALTLNGTNLLGIPIRVEYTEAEKNRQAAAGETKPVHNPLAARIHVGSLNFSLSDVDVSAVFRPFGEIEFVDLHRDNESGRSKGYCFIQFKNPADAQNALEKMNGFQLAGRPIKVNKVTEKNAVNTTASSTNGDDSNAVELGEGIGGMNNISRIDLMQKLSRAPAQEEAKPMYRPNIPDAKSKCVLLKNMFNPEEETEPNWDVDLCDDVKDEANNKYGEVADIFINKDSSEGEIYIKFAEQEGAEKALGGLDGRWFGGRQIKAIYVTDAIMDANRK